MERGPMALFGAIVAVGLGPAMWLGAQFGEATLTPARQPAVTVQQNTTTEPRGGAGAGDAPTDQTQIIRTEPKANTETIRTGPRAKPPAASPTPSSSPSKKPAADPTQSAPPADDDSDEPSTPPVEESTGTTTPPADDESEPPTPPDPPSTDSAPDEVVGA